MAIHSQKLADTQPELARLEALARVAGAAAHGGGLDAVLTAIVQGVQDAFGLEVVLNLFDPELDRYVARAVASCSRPETMRRTSIADVRWCSAAQCRT